MVTCGLLNSFNTPMHAACHCVYTGTCLNVLQCKGKCAVFSEVKCCIAVCTLQCECTVLSVQCFSSVSVQYLVYSPHCVVSV